MLCRKREVDNLKRRQAPAPVTTSEQPAVVQVNIVTVIFN